MKLVWFYFVTNFLLKRVENFSSSYLKSRHSFLLHKQRHSKYLEHVFFSENAMTSQKFYVKLCVPHKISCLSTANLL